MECGWYQGEALWTCFEIPSRLCVYAGASEVLKASCTLSCINPAMIVLAVSACLRHAPDDRRIRRLNGGLIQSTQ